MRRAGVGECRLSKLPLLWYSSVVCETYSLALVTVGVHFPSTVHMLRFKMFLSGRLTSRSLRLTGGIYKGTHL